MLNDVKAMFGIKAVEFYHNDKLVYSKGEFDKPRLVWNGKMRNYR